MTTPSIKGLKVFYSYAHKDQEYRQQLENHLSNLKRLYQLRTWFDREIIPGENWEQVLDEHLNTADLIFLLISPDFMASDYCYNKEMQRALKRRAKGAAKLIPIYMRNVHWKDAPFSTIQMLPKDALPVTRWPDIDDAFYDTVLGIEQVIKQLLFSRKTKEEWLTEGNVLNALKKYNEALDAYQQAIRLDPNNAIAYHNMGNTLNALNKNHDALPAYQPAIVFDSRAADDRHIHGNLTRRSNDLEQALEDVNKHLLFDPNTEEAWHKMGIILNALKKYNEALDAYQQAIRLDPNDAIAYHSMG